MTDFDLSQRQIIVAIATEPGLVEANPFPDQFNLPGEAISYGQDLTFGTGQAAPNRQSVGNSEAELKPLMREMVNIFARADSGGMAKRLFDRFLQKQSSVTFFEDGALTAAAGRHPNIIAFCNAALSVPNSVHKAPGKVRIHQALAAANWDINKITAPTDLGAPAFNLGQKWTLSGDWSNGLGVMIDAEQHVYVVATKYHYDGAKNQYNITLKFLFYDVFGLDDEDLKTFGAQGRPTTPPVTLGPPLPPVTVPPVNVPQSLLPWPIKAEMGITAWWQLQHQFGYAPLVTRIVLERSYEVSTK